MSKKTIPPGEAAIIGAFLRATARKYNIDRDAWRERYDALLHDGDQLLRWTAEYGEASSDVMLASGLGLTHQGKLLPFDRAWELARAVVAAERGPEPDFADYVAKAAGTSLRDLCVKH